MIQKIPEQEKAFQLVDLPVRQAYPQGITVYHKMLAGSNPAIEFTKLKSMQTGEWISAYLASHKSALEALPVEDIQAVIELVAAVHASGKQVFALGNGGSAANASHFTTDLGKGASDAMDKPFRCPSLTDNVPWITAIGNDYSYDDVFLRQLANLGQPGDLVIGASVSGDSENLVRAFAWARDNGLKTLALVSARGGRLASLADRAIRVKSTHYGIVEDCQMTILHLICYAFMEKVVSPQTLDIPNE